MLDLEFKHFIYDMKHNMFGTVIGTVNDKLVFIDMKTLDTVVVEQIFVIPNSYN